MRRPSLPAVISALTVGAAVIFVLLQLQPGLIVANTTPAGGDMGAHVWGPDFLRHNVLPHFRLTGWTPDWYAGFPAFHFYFPLPSLAIVALDLVLPYGVAFKVVAVSGIVGMPAAAWAFGRLSRLPFPTPPLLAIATLPFIFDRFHTIWGGNAASTLAGEYSFSIALSLALVFLGVFAHSLETGGHRVTAALLLAATALSHLLPTAFAVMGAIALVVMYRPSRARSAVTATVAAIGFLVSATWVVPFLARLPYSNDMGWERTNTYLEHLLPFLRDDPDVAPALTRHLWVVVPLAAVGFVAALVRRRRGAILVAVLAAGNGIGFMIVPDGRIWNARLLPFWYLTLYLLAAIAIAEIAIVVAETIRGSDNEGDRAPRVIAVALTAFAVFIVTGAPLQAVPSWIPVSKTDVSFIPDWARWNFSGYERKAAYPEYAEVIDTMATVGRDNGCGRAMWEYEPQLDRYGTPMALMLLPFWTDGCIGSMEGLYFESSATVPYHFLNQSELSHTPSRAIRDLPYRSLDLTAGIAHLRLMGVKYYMAISPQAQAVAQTEPGLTFVASTNDHAVNYPDAQNQPRHWQIYEVDDAPLVEPLEFRPAVVSALSDRESWLDASVDWFQDDRRWDVPLAADGPADWPDLTDPSAEPRKVAVRSASVSNIKTSDDSISFDVDQIGVPVLVKTSYFPNWKAKGADGPYRVTPNFMVVVPTATDVELSYGWTGVDLAAWAMTFLGLGLAVLFWRRGAVSMPAPAEVPAEIYVDPFGFDAAQADGFTPEPPSTIVSPPPPDDGGVVATAVEPDEAARP